MLTPQVWVGRLATVLLLFIVMRELGAGALLWLVPTLVAICLGCYAEKEIRQLEDFIKINRRLNAVLKRMEEGKRL
jgi:hypothetical protein